MIKQLFNSINNCGCRICQLFLIESGRFCWIWCKSLKLKEHSVCCFRTFVGSGFEPQTSTNACQRKYVDWKGLVAILTFIQSAGVAPEVNLRSNTQARNVQVRNPPWLWNPGRMSPEGLVYTAREQDWDSTGNRTRTNGSLYILQKCSHWSETRKGTRMNCYLWCWSSTLYLYRSLSRAMWISHKTVKYNEMLRCDTVNVTSETMLHNKTE